MVKECFYMPGEKIIILKTNCPILKILFAYELYIFRQSIEHILESFSLLSTIAGLIKIVTV